MDPLPQAKEPFRFHTRLNLTELTGLRASVLPQLLKLIKQVPGACIYHHTHRFLEQHQYLSPEPPNDFAYWVSEVIGEDELAEQLASIDTVQFPTIRSLRDQIAQTIETYVAQNPLATLRFAGAGEEFHFIKSVSFIIPTPYIANNLEEFAQILEKITIDSIYFHVFEARLRLEHQTNDFSNWIDTALGCADIAGKLARLDPYAYTMEELRRRIISIVRAGYAKT
ncbi:MAG: DUF5752 family protein [Candidatus Omnitrophica bacterium]|nr:hypothetical protein [Candidatus Omnitrophota bacterium]MDD4940391.1 DUF5752 family protein [Candidatus Omnitrophota bacterium]